MVGKEADWTEPQCNCPDPELVPPGFQAALDSWQCLAGYVGNAQKICPCNGAVSAMAMASIQTESKRTQKNLKPQTDISWLLRAEAFSWDVTPLSFVEPQACWTLTRARATWGVS